MFKELLKDVNKSLKGSFKIVKGAIEVGILRMDQ